MGPGRRCQVLVVRIITDSNAVLDKVYVAKCYDPTLCPDVERTEWPGGTQQNCTSLKNTETKAYKILHQLQGTDLPTFYGVYKYDIPNNISSRYVEADAILLEVINHSTLGDIDPGDLSPDEKLELKRLGDALLAKIHNLGVYHHDITPENLLWDRRKSLKLIDFEAATFRDGNGSDRTKEWIALDRGKLISLLEGYGIKDERPAPAPWFFGWSV